MHHDRHRLADGVADGKAAPPSSSRPPLSGNRPVRCAVCLCAEHDAHLASCAVAHKGTWCPNIDVRHGRRSRAQESAKSASSAWQWISTLRRRSEASSGSCRVQEQLVALGSEHEPSTHNPRRLRGCLEGSHQPKRSTTLRHPSSASDTDPLASPFRGRPHGDAHGNRKQGTLRSRYVPNSRRRLCAGCSETNSVCVTPLDVPSSI